MITKILKHVKTMTQGSLDDLSQGKMQEISK
jgi:hypothetical protein